MFLLHKISNRAWYSILIDQTTVSDQGRAAHDGWCRGIQRTRGRTWASGASELSSTSREAFNSRCIR